MADSIKVALLTEPGGPHLGIYIDCLAANPHIREVSVADSGGAIFKEAQAKWKRRFGEVPTYQDYRTLLSERRPDLVVACYSSSHAPEPIEAALRAGCHVLAEKPACVRPADFERLNTLATQKRRKLMLALATRVNPLVAKARDLVRSGALGKLYGSSMHFIADQARLRKPEYQASWFASKERAGGGHLLWLGIHYVDAAQFISGQMITRVCGFTGNVGGQPINVEDAAAVTLEFQDGMLGTMHSGYYLDHGYHGQIRIWGSDGWLRADLISGEPLEWYLNAGKEVHKLAGPPGRADTYVPFLEAVVDSVRLDTPPPVSGAECLQALRAVFGLYDAASTGRTQNLS